MLAPTLPLMVYDAALADRIRVALDGVPAVAERRMFGGLAFLVAGNMAVCATHEGLMVRAGAEATPDLLATTHAGEMRMGERVMSGWVLVAPEHLGDTELDRWVELGATTAGSLPAK